jgi:hypothetical protein
MAQTGTGKKKFEDGVSADERNVIIFASFSKARLFLLFTSVPLVEGQRQMVG